MHRDLLRRGLLLGLLSLVLMSTVVPALAERPELKQRKQQATPSPPVAADRRAASDEAADIQSPASKGRHAGFRLPEIRSR